MPVSEVSGFDELRVTALELLDFSIPPDLHNHDGLLAKGALSAATDTLLFPDFALVND